MNVSPLQPKGMAFDKVTIVPTSNDGSFMSAENFDFSGVKINCDVGFSDISADHEAEPNTFMVVALNTRIDNAEGKTCPYQLNLGISGVFEWLDPRTSFEARCDLIVVNGASLLYGAIREMVSTVTARSVCGPLMLPALSFKDNAPSLRKEDKVNNKQDEEASRPGPKRLRRARPQENRS